MKKLSSKFINLVREIYNNESPVVLHRPYFDEDEKKSLSNCIDSNFVSSAGPEISQFEKEISRITGLKHVIATVNGTSALHLAMHELGLSEDNEVITQALTFVATANAISYTGAKPVFLDVDLDTYGLSPEALDTFLSKSAHKTDLYPINKKTKKIIKAVVPMHTFGCPSRIKDIYDICQEWGLDLIEDCAESLGSFSDGLHTGKLARVSTLSFNGNKIITTGGGGAVLTDDTKIANSIRHIATTAKKQHPHRYIHDQVSYNYRMPNLNAVLGLAQISKLSNFLEKKRKLHTIYKDFFDSYGYKMQEELKSSSSNFWLNSIEFNNSEERDYFLKSTNSQNVFTRQIWDLMHSLNMFKACERDSLKNSKYLFQRVVNIPSSYYQ